MTFDAQCDLAALVYERDQEPDRLLQEFAVELIAQGHRAVGLVQLRDQVDALRLSGLLLHSGETLPLFQDLGPLSTGCKLDTGQLLNAGARVASAIDEGADIVIVNRFGRQEREGKGLIDLIDRALSADIPVVIAVPAERFDDWIKYAEGMSVRLRCDRLSLEQWWDALSSRNGRAARHAHATVCEVLK